VLAAGGVACGHLAGVLHRFDGVRLREPELIVSRGGNGRRVGARRRDLAVDRVVTIDGVPCTDALQTLVDLACDVDDDIWEQALESALRRRLVTVSETLSAAEGMRGVARVRRVVARRSPHAAPTESLLETLMVQLVRTVAGVPDPVRQLEVLDEDGDFVARVDLAWPGLGVFVELDGQQHKDQPEYDARRETAVVAATGWLCARFTWREVVHLPATTGRRLAAVVDQARRRTAA